MTDPYQVLGISRGAPDDEIKKQYRKLSRIYHPDANVNNPDKAQAEERFKQIQQAYDQVMKERQQGFGYGPASGTSSAGGGGSAGGGYRQTGDFESFFRGFGSFNGYRTDSGNTGESTRLQAAANYIRSRHFAEALHVLGDIPVSERQAKWYYYSALANQGAGNQAAAVEFINQAVRMEPGNLQYRQYQQNLQSGSNWYNSMSGVYERPFSSGSSCMSILMEMLLCSCCCGGPC